MFSGMFESCFDIDLTINEESDIRQALRLAPLPTCKGTLLFADEHDRAVQLLLAANIRRTATARLFPEGESVSKRADLRAIVRKIYYTRCFNDLRNALHHYSTARAIYPKEYRRMLKLVKPTLVKIDMGANWPYFQISNDLKTDGDCKIFGPFESQRSASDFIQILQNGFDLCHMPNLISDPEKAKSCPYLQMGNCPAPCVGNITRQEYLTQIDNAVDAAAGNVNIYIQEFTRKMQRAADYMEFEKAQHVKKQIEQLKLLSKNSFKWTSDLSKLCILHIDKSVKMPVNKRKKQQLYTAFLIRAGYITELGDYSLEALECVLDMLKLQTQQPYNIDSDLYLAKDIFSITCYHLYRSSRQGVWMDISAAIPTYNCIKDTVVEKYKIESEENAT